MAAQTHQSDARILGRRTLARDQRRLAELLRPGMAVLDVGCGTGAITKGIAEAVGETGAVVGLDRDEGLLALAREQHGGIGNLTFESGDATTMDHVGRFDIVTAARTLQWISDPERAVNAMVRATKPGGLVVVLDYNHRFNRWNPEPPREFAEFYRAFLKWREVNHWDNLMADHIEELFRRAGLREIAGRAEDEVSERGDADFAERSMLWPETIEKIGTRVTDTGFYPETAMGKMRAAYEEWARGTMARQTLCLRSVVGRVGAG